jgi:cytoskeletal protein CcmA (bactofilin family)
MFGRSSQAHPAAPAANDERRGEPPVVHFKDATEVQRGERPAPENAAVSVIGESLHFKGELSAGEDLIIEGTVEGKINQGKCCLTLRPNGRIIADVNATKIFIDGTVQGDLRATVSVTIRATGNVTGNIIAPRIAVDDGATFNGTIEMRDPAQKV